MLLAWAGKGSDCSKLFHVTEVEHSSVLDMPNWVHYFYDPCKMIHHYKSCPLNEKKRQSQRKGYVLGTVYTEAFGTELQGAHNSLKDAQAQGDIVAFESTNPNQWSCYLKSRQGNEIELLKLMQNQLVRCHLDGQMRGLQNGTCRNPNSTLVLVVAAFVGPTNSVTSVCQGRDLSDLFLYFFTMEILQRIVDETNRYGNAQWVHPLGADEWCSQYYDSGDKDSEDTGKEIDLNAMNSQYNPGDANDESIDANEESIPNSDDMDSMSGRSTTISDSRFSLGDVSDESLCGDHSIDSNTFEAEPKRTKRLIPCKEDHPDRRKRFQRKDKEWITVTVAYLLAWFGILVIMAALRIRKWDYLWMEHQGINIPFIQNAMTSDTFKQIKSCIHFVNNEAIFKPGHPSFHPLQKIQPFIDKILKIFRQAYTIGQFLSAGESMIKYKGKSVKFV
ncbi:hypothetical protein ACHAWF_012747 [Thalassiosira exigua]